MSDDLAEYLRKVAAISQERDSYVEAIKALLVMLGGAVTISSAEISVARKLDLHAENLDKDHLIMRVEKE